jgi:pimeloyl-ACP methyl ester carboxylesterase
MQTNLVTRFCTPPRTPVTETESRGLATADCLEVSFEGDTVRCYSWGDGPTVILVHGWGSRASHLALLGRHLAGRGFRAVAYDSPAHSSDRNETRTTSNMFELCRALSAVAAATGEVYGVVGHSFGGAVAAFTIAGNERLDPYRFDVQKLVLVNAPASVASVITAFGARNQLNEAELTVLRSGLESDFAMSIAVYSVGTALRSVAHVPTLLIHDCEDEEFPIDDAFQVCREAGNLRLIVTEGYGHSRILASRAVMKHIDRFLSE